MKKILSVLILVAMLLVGLSSCYHEHNFDEWIITKNATCTKDGMMVRYCDCGEKQTEVIPFTGHKYVNGECVNCSGNNLETPDDTPNETPDEDPTNPDTLVDPTPTEKTYTLSIVVDEGLGSVNARNTYHVTALALIYDADGKIVAARFDSVAPRFALNTDKTDIVAISRVDTKVELGYNYSYMPSGSWETQAKAFEAYLVGKTVAEVAALDFQGAGADLVAGCTLSSSMPTFQRLVAKAFAYERNVTFKTAETITLGLAIDASVSGSVADGGKITADFAAVAMVGDKVAAVMIDSAEAKYDLAIAEEELTVTLREYKGTKNEQGDAYDSYRPLPSGRWYAQVQTFANATVGKTSTEIAAMDNTLVAGCTIYTAGYKATIIRAIGYAR